MNPNKFTEEQIDDLRRNPYTFHVSEKTIKYTLAFKQLYIEARNSGKRAEDVFREYGYDPEVLGFYRVKRFDERVRKEAKSPEGLMEKNHPRCVHPGEKDYAGMSDAEAMRHMQGEILYLHQELDFIKKNYISGEIRRSEEMIQAKPSAMFELIQTTLNMDTNRLTVSELCKLANVSRSGYYRWVSAAPIREAREAEDRADFDLILWAYKKRGYSKGARGIQMALLHKEPMVVMNLKKIRRLMDKYGLMCPIRKANPYRRMAKALKTSNVAAYLVKREFTKYGPRMILLTDITYIPYNGIFAYLSTILDAFTKEVLAYVLSPSLEVDFVLETVQILIRDHGISLTSETIINSDQGCHYTSYSFIQIIKDAELRQSMSHKGCCWDNAPQESFFGHMKDEIDLSECTELEEVKAIIDDWMEYYNNERYQWQLAKLSPKEFNEFIRTGIFPLKVKNPPKKEDFISKLTPEEPAEPAARDSE